MNQQQYNYGRFQPQEWGQENFTGGLALGDSFPFDLQVYSELGKEIPLHSLLGKRFVLETGSLSCPHFIENIPRMNELDEKFKDTSFVTLYVREEHPGEILCGHQSLDQKIDRANVLRLNESEERTVFIDNPQGDLHKELGLYPNCLYVVDKTGKVEFKRYWNQPDELHIYLAGLMLGTTKDADTPYEPDPCRWRTTFRVLAKAGPKALAHHIWSRPYVWKERSRERECTGKSMTHGRPNQLLDE